MATSGERECVLQAGSDLGYAEVKDEQVELAVALLKGKICLASCQLDLAKVSATLVFQERLTIF